MTTEYQDFLHKKVMTVSSCGMTIDNSAIHEKLFPFQRDLVRWAVMKGRCAIFADTGLGKTYMSLEWARIIGKDTIIIAPLSVAKQTQRMANDIDVKVTMVRSMSDVENGINITNYEMIKNIDPSKFGAVVLDESSILKSLAGKTRLRLTEMFSDTKYKLCCTATPAPNDIAEIANHAEFLGIMSRADMLATFFVHDDTEWRLKGHAKEAFFRWMASWGMSIKKPSDLGYDDDGFILPDLNINLTRLSTEQKPDGTLFFMGLKGIRERSGIRKSTINDKLDHIVELINKNKSQWLVWHGLNDEGRLLNKAIDDAILVEGQQDTEEKEKRLCDFQEGRIRVLITKPKIAGFGMNFQNCSNIIFMGLSDSWESYYQCIRRCWRYGQRKNVNVHIVITEPEREIYDNVMQKNEQAESMSKHLIENVQEYERQEMGMTTCDFKYENDEVHGEGYKLILGDCNEVMASLQDESVDLSVFSPPFMSLYTYSATERDVGNSKTEKEFFDHFGFTIRHLLRVTKSGRNCSVHVSQVPAMLVRDNYIGLKDFRGKTITAFEDNGWIYHGEVCIDKDPQAQAIRTHSKALLFAQLKKDASWLRPALADYILVFRKPGENQSPIKPDLTNDEWIEWARPIWYGIHESDTLQYSTARDDNDERHICPLQLGTIERVVRLWSNPGDTILSPFAGIGSEGYEALRLERKFIGIELKKSYYEIAKRNLHDAINKKKQVELWNNK